ncbi:PLP-dependent aminotransferase family protein [Pseudactinotalea terrae]|uniref:MocR-like pyridoxine biosynthesis transcription factor PdxR n=1 Tax=Pseudactinotalea terrae TaxID=1743262 RepID=UPI0012E103B7|nr:PLP-dependent aminotransferase family protein [Pseudactinotalea terrae]
MLASQTNLAWHTLLDLEADGPLVTRVEQGLRRAVRSGEVPEGTMLPPSRRMAETLGVSRWVVTQVYEQLVAEGVLEARVGAGTRVARTRPPSSPGGERELAGPVPPLPRRPSYDLRPGVADLRHVPREAWTRAMRDALAKATNDDFATAPAAGHPATRTAVADHLREARMVDAPAAAVVITRGATDAMGRVGAALRAAGHTHLLVEDPCWPMLRDVAQRAGLTPVPVPVDDAGIDVGALVRSAEATGARAAVVTPAHQFPLGVPLAGERREALLAWAREADGIVIEDDYDAEFRYDRRPVAALQRLDPGRVLLLGSTSKTMSPAFGIGWMVAPASWRESLTASAGEAPSVLAQLAMTEMLTSGAYDRHLRAARLRYRRRHDTVVAAIETCLPTATMSGLAAGLHLVLELGPESPDAADVVRAAAELDVGITDMRRYEAAPSASSRRLVLGYGNLADGRLPDAVALLAACARARG